MPFCRDPADNTPTPPDRRTPSHSANLQAPRDTWVQLRTASLVEPIHHVSVCPLTWVYLYLFIFLNIYPFLVSPPLLEKLEQTLLSLGSILTKHSALFQQQIWSRPSYATVQNLTWALTGRHRELAPVPKNKFKVHRSLY